FPAEKDRIDYYVVYNSYEVISDSRFCNPKDCLIPPGREMEIKYLESSIPPMPLGPPTGYEYETEIAFQTDYEYYVNNGSSTTTVVQDIESIFSGVNIAYKRDVDITWVIGDIIISTASGAPFYEWMLSSSTLLNTFRTDWRNNHTDIPRDVAHMMCGRSFSDAPTIGLAWVRSVCDGVINGYGYAIVSTNFTANYKNRVTLSAHEIGHNYGCNGHCDGSGDCHIMCSALGGCNGVGSPNFGAWAITQITNYADGETCHDLVPATSIVKVSTNLFVDGIQVEADPPDVNGKSEGEIPFNLEYLDGVQLTLTAPLEHQYLIYLYRFDHWVLDGANQPDGQADLTLNADFIEAKAVYGSATAFEIKSSPINGVPITVDPGDLDNVIVGPTPLPLVYFIYTNVTAEAPRTHGTYQFYRWILNGVEQPILQTDVSFSVPVYSTPNLKAVYYPRFLFNGFPHYSPFSSTPIRTRCP
ncbi:MAG: hypothetical protein KJ645_04610, partial [Planctomycetes bacterium]|nr:hypothetical protein [Planctomycetota bacterium]